MADFYLKDIVPLLARAIKDLGTLVRDDPCGTGDGTKTTFRATYYPVKIGSLTAYVDGSAVTIADYDYTYGLFTLASAPALGKSVTANYIYYGYPDGLLQDYIADATIRLELKYYQGYVVKRDANDDAYLETTPDQRIQMLFVLQATILFVESGLAKENLVTSRLFRDDEIQQSYTKSALLARTYLEKLYQELDSIIDMLTAEDSDYGELVETKFNTDEAKYRYLDSIALGAYEEIG